MSCLFTYLPQPEKNRQFSPHGYSIKRLWRYQTPNITIRHATNVHLCQLLYWKPRSNLTLTIPSPRVDQPCPKFCSTTHEPPCSVVVFPSSSSACSCPTHLLLKPCLTFIVQCNVTVYKLSTLWRHWQTHDSKNSPTTTCKSRLGTIDHISTSARH